MNRTEQPLLNTTSPTDYKAGLEKLQQDCTTKAENSLLDRDLQTSYTNLAKSIGSDLTWDDKDFKSIYEREVEQYEKLEDQEGKEVLERHSQKCPACCSTFKTSAKLTVALSFLVLFIAGLVYSQVNGGTVPDLLGLFKAA